MNEIIETTNRTPIEIALDIDKNDMTTAKKLYEFLELNPAHYARWFRTNIIENEFAEENVDFTPFTINGECGGQATQDAKLTAHFAKKAILQGKWRKRRTGKRILHNLRGLNLDINKANMLGRKASKLSREYEYPIGKTKDVRFGEINTYHVDILKEVFKM